MRQNLSMSGMSWVYKKTEIYVSRFKYVRTVKNFSLGGTNGKEIPRKFRRGW